MKPYKIVDDGPTHITYEYNSAYTWALYAGFAALVVGMAIANNPLRIVGGLVIVAYFGIKLTVGSELNDRINEAMKSDLVEVTGHKASFSNPVRIRVPK